MSHSLHGLSKHDQLVKECLEHQALNSSQPLPQVFGYLLDENPVTGNLSKEHIVNAFDALVDEMVTDDLENGPADAGMTFLGQFVDHDITLDAKSAIGTKIDPRSIRNIRTPNLDLDCVYGDGPEASPYMYSPDHEGFMLFGRKKSPLDLARNCKGRALIGDPRNDENIIVSQIQGAFICLHNILMSHVEEGDEMAKDVHDCAQMGIRSDVWKDVVPPKLMGFEQVRRFTRLHYQWIVLNELLPAFVDQSVIDATLAHDPFHDLGPIMPAEFSGAAYRFGHATVQPSYKLKKDQEPVDLFKMLGFQPRGTDSDLEFRMFFDVAGTKAQRARPIGMQMARTLHVLPDNIVGAGLQWGEHAIPVEQAKKLALRNILRDRTALKLPSGQQVAAKLGIAALPAPDILKQNHIDKTPLWVYCLQEAETKGKGKLTGAGGAIVASVIIRLLKLDRESVLHMHGFEPWSGFGDTCTMGSIMQFVEAHRDHISHREDLWCD
ncbi:MAG: peroxidase family protein [Pseudomonadota bacterium]